MFIIKNLIKKCLFLSLVIVIISCKNSGVDNGSMVKGNLIDLSGEWQVKLDSLDQGETEKWFAQDIDSQVINLPGTLDDAGIGVADTLSPGLNNYVLSSLTRKKSYIGKAWYQKKITIPEDWSGKQIELKLERVLWQSTVYIGAQKIGSQESLIGSHSYNLDTALPAGDHTLTIVIDNSNFYPNINVIGDRYPLKVNQEMAHAYTNHTQIKWNGILGEISVTATNKQDISNLQVYPDVSEGKLDVSFETANSSFNDVINIEFLDQEDTSIYSQEVSNLSVQDNKVSFSITRPEGIKEWDEFNPVTYNAVLKSKDQRLESTFGYRNISMAGSQLQLNDHRIFLRGNLECVIFPLTGYPPMKVEEWDTLYKQAKNYGINHIRFHSWCPPEAAFTAADNAGMYLQVELPHWSLKVGEDENTTAFLKKEADKMLKDYGHHPSFVFFSMGNELEGDFSVLNSMVADLKQKDSRHLYATTSFSFQKPAGTRPEPEDEFFIAQWTDKGWIRGQGVFNAFPPNFNKDFTANSSHIEIPLISHEIGQYSVYPDLSEIEKYTGVLKPLNFIAVKNDLEEKGLVDLAPQFTLSSGKLAAMLYKEEIERALKTPSFDGFQLLQLQDFPGQGTALVGLLNAFWESKGAISGEEFRQFSSPLVPLVRFEKAIYENGENFKAELEVANFYKDLENQKLTATLKDSKGNTIKEVYVENKNIPIGNNRNLGTLEVPVSITNADVWTLELSLDGTDFKNSWSVWVYPTDNVESSNDIISTQSFDEAIRLLDAGKTVLFNPNIEELRGVEGRFVPVFWSPVHFPNQPGTMGLLMDPNDPALADFPTQDYTQWQWWDLCIKSKSVILDDVNVKPIVRVIDNFVTNHDLANLFEAQVGNGKLVFSSMDITNDLKNRPAARQLRTSILNYMNSDEFKPENVLTSQDLKSFKK